MSYNFKIRNGEGVSKIAVKGRYERREEREGDLLKSTKNPCKDFRKSSFPSKVLAPRAFNSTKNGPLN